MVHLLYVCVCMGLPFYVRICLRGERERERETERGKNRGPQKGHHSQAGEGSVQMMMREGDRQTGREAYGGMRVGALSY